MAFTAPPTFITGKILNASDLNTYIRDNLNATAVGITTQANDLFYASGALALTNLRPGTSDQGVMSNASVPIAFTIPALWNSQTLGGSAASFSIDVSNTSGNRLRIIAYLRTTSGNTNDNLLVRFNNISTATYDWQRYYINNSALTSPAATLGDTSMAVGIITGGTGTANTFSAVLIEIHQYLAAINKSIQVLCGEKHGTVAGSLYMVSAHGMWKSTAAITSIQLIPASGSFAAGSSVQTYIE